MNKYDFNFCEKIGEKSLNFMKSRVNYVQNAQKNYVKELTSA